MPVINAPNEFNEEDLYVDLMPVLGRSLFLKCEGFNFAGSVKLKAAAEMVETAERDGTLSPGSIIVESSSGNLGVALSMLAASKGYGFLCVTDSRCNASTRRLMEALGAEVHVVSEASDAEGGLLGARLAHVRRLCASDERYVWLDQYGNPGNWRAHYRTTAPAIVRQFPDLDVLFVGTGTAGTLMGCARYLRERHRPDRSCARFLRERHRPVPIVAVDSVGSVTFGAPPGRRLIPGVGAGVRPRQLEESYVDDVVHVDEGETIRTCRRLARRGFLFGGSTGTTVSGALDWLSRNDTGRRRLTAVAISPDLGERYFETVYANGWVQEHYGEDVLAGHEPLPDLDRVERHDRAGLRRRVGDHPDPVRRRGPGPRRPRIGVPHSL